MIYQWRVEAVVSNDGLTCVLDVLGRTEEEAKEQFEEQVVDFATRETRFLKVTKTGWVLVREEDVKR